MSMLVDLEKPAFYTAVYMTPAEGMDPGLYSEAASTLVSTAMLLSGFVGFADDDAERDRTVKIVYWRTYHAMRAWRRTARDLLPHRIDIDDCVASEGCHWQWFGDRDLSRNLPRRHAA
jgi:heme-degrading monooxygenase HmoA